ncbi:hypothetical protein N24_1643 [Corynebacterium suranareeae]|uniref:Uncharacterized protein n=1 Tax=Corynebacterium suranareeae TaxID=2506452 RepID=A0A160PQX2_9CORY|nr:anti-sigma factor [Corynebacterium suranareeae]BAU95905.1 hypothetical protein N24_1643 [Corynebacterium suranareeae]
MTSKGQPSSSDSSTGMDYVVRYSLNEFQRGSMVTRFNAFPGKREVFEVLEKYGISSAQVSDYSVIPAPGVQQARIHNSQQELAPTPQPAQETQPVTSRPPREKPKRKGGCGWAIIALVLLIFALPAATADRARHNGELAVMPYVSEMGFGERLEFCINRLDSLAESTSAIWGEDPGFFEDRVSPSLLHPANFSYMIGCMSD